MILSGTSHKIPLQRPQEGKHARLFAPAFWWLGSCWFAVGEGLGFQFQIDLGIDVGRVERDVPQPGADRVDVHSSPEEVNCRGVTDRVCPHFLLGEGRWRSGRYSYRDLKRHQRSAAERTCSTVRLRPGEASNSLAMHNSIPAYSRSLLSENPSRLRSFRKRSRSSAKGPSR